MESENVSAEVMTMSVKKEESTQINYVHPSTVEL